METVQGVLYKKSFAGLGIGIDYYRFRSVPIFLQLRQQFGQGKRNILLYTNGGKNIDWLTDKNKEGTYGMVDYKGGWYYDLGIGYKIPLRQDNAFLLTTGYSYKEIRKNYSYQNCQFPGSCEIQSEHSIYTMSRISVRMAFQF